MKKLKILLLSIVFFCLSCAAVPVQQDQAPAPAAVIDNPANKLSDYYVTDQNGKTQALPMVADLGIVTYLENEGMDIKFIWFAGNEMCICGAGLDGVDRCESFLFDDVRHQFGPDWRTYGPETVQRLDYDTTLEVLKNEIMKSAS
jgi:hypothetical protein